MCDLFLFFQHTPFSVFFLGGTGADARPARDARAIRKPARIGPGQPEHGGIVGKIAPTRWSPWSVICWIAHTMAVCVGDRAYCCARVRLCLSRLWCSCVFIVGSSSGRGFSFSGVGVILERLPRKHILPNTVRKVSASYIQYFNNISKYS